MVFGVCRLVVGTDGMREESADFSISKQPSEFSVGIGVLKSEKSQGTKDNNYMPALKEESENEFKKEQSKKKNVVTTNEKEEKGKLCLCLCV